MDELLKTIDSSLSGIKFELEDDLKKSKNGISLLALKNESLLAYLHHLVLIIAGMMERSGGRSIEEDFQKSVESSIVHRVVMEKGVKGLENKIAYQIEKALRAYLKSKKEAEERVTAKQDYDQEAADSDEEELSFKPNPFGLSASRETTTDSNVKYVAPKITAVNPFDDKEKPTARQRKNVTMEEYLEEASGAPMAAPSIGSTIVDGGRGGERTEKDRRKQKEIQDYEEDNYIRLPGETKKQQKRAAKQRQRDANGKNLFGEDWGFLETIGSKGKGGGDDGAQRSKRRKTSAWERAKKRAALE